MKLNLGSGTTPKPGYTNVDLYTTADIVHDLTHPLPFDDGSVEEILACHIIEHFTRSEWELIRLDWARVLQPGGKLEIWCPDLDKLCRLWLYEPSPLRLSQIYGHQSTPGEFHKNGFTEKTLHDSFPGFKARMLHPTTDYELHMLLLKPDKGPIL